MEFRMKTEFNEYLLCIMKMRSFGEFSRVPSFLFTYCFIFNVHSCLLIIYQGISHDEQLNNSFYSFLRKLYYFNFFYSMIFSLLALLLSKIPSWQSPEVHDLLYPNTLDNTAAQLPISSYIL